MDEVKESCPLHVTLICRLYYPFPWSQISHNSCSFFAHCIQVFSLVNVPDDARQKSGRCWRTWYCNMFDSPLPALDITAAFVVVPALPKYVFFSASPGINFTHQNMGWGGCLFLLPFPLQIAPRIHGSVKLGRRGGPIQSALRNFCPSPPKHFTPFFIIASPPTSCL